MLNGPRLLQTHPLLVVRAAIVILHGTSVPQVGVVGGVRVLFQHAFDHIRLAVTFVAHDAVGKWMRTRLD